MMIILPYQRAPYVSAPQPTQAPVTPVVTGSRAANVALASLLTGLASDGTIVDQTVP